MSPGAAPPLVLLHGWGLNGRVFDALVAALADRFTVLRPDLPGHGQSAADPVVLERGIDALAAQLAAAIPQRAHLLGWSLGGLAALAIAAAQPERVARLTLIATTPRFVTSADWPHGMAPAVLETFATQLREDYRRTVFEFLELQVRGSTQAAGTLRELQAALEAQGAATPRALAAGLALLRDVDLRARLGSVAAPALVISGQHDRITPPRAGAALARALPHAEYREIARAGHAPFLSHAALVAEWIAEAARAP